MGYKIYLVSAPGYWYVGQTRRTLAQRFRDHKRPDNGCGRLRDKMQELGSDAFTIELLQEVTRDAHEAELRWYRYLIENGRGQTLNGCTPGAYPDPTPERNAKISASHTGMRHTEASRAKMSAQRKGRKMSSESSTKKRVAMQGKQNALGYLHTPEAIAKIAAASRGRTHTPATRAKMSESAKNRRKN